MIDARELNATEHAALAAALMALEKPALVETLLLMGDAETRRELMALATPVLTSAATYDVHAQECCLLLNRIAAAVPRAGTVGWQDAAAIAHLEAVLRDAAAIIGA